MDSPVRDLVVVGASAGGVAALRLLASQLAPAFPATMAVVLHTGAHPSRLAQLLAASGPNAAGFAQHGDTLRPARIVTAVPDHHLLVRDGIFHLTRGPKERHTRPAIDPLFRSAALWGGPRVIGVLLSGRNDDGTAGMQAIRACGGVTIVQDPEDAEEPAMPRSALDHVLVDHCAPLPKIAELLGDLAGQPAPAAFSPPEALVREHAAALGEGEPAQQLRAIGMPSILTCPDCSGTLFEIADTRPQRFRCHTGHAFTMKTLHAAQNELTEQALWSAIRALVEKETLLRRMSALDRTAGDTEHAMESDAQADRILQQINELRRLL